ncbi:LVIVD repeat-containing protein [Nocardiopsis sp. NPDC055551]
MPAASPRRGGVRRSTVVALTAAATLLAGLLGPASAQADAPPSEDVTSENVEHIANLPKPEAVSNTNSDMAFTGDYVIGGNYDGFVIYDVSEPADPEIVSEVLCPGGQGDLSVSGDLVYFAVDYPNASDECGAPAVPVTDPDGFEGVRVFDISDKANPQYVAAVRTDCGSHTLTLVPGDDEREYVYVSSYAPAEEFPNCQPPHDKISVIEVPLDDPASAALVNEPVLFPDGGNHDQDGLLRPTEGCHDITAYPEKDLAAGACMGDGVLMDISDPVEPVVTEVVQDENFAFWHSATFTNDASTVIFTDELGGGGAATCTEEIGPERGANAIYTLDGEGTDATLDFESYYKLERHQGDEQVCVAHNGSLIPVPGQNYFVQAWYQGGVSVIDFNDPKNPREIGHWDPDDRIDPDIENGSSWSAYYYNGHVYSSDMRRGLDVLELTDPRLRPAERVTYDEFNPQTQPSYRPGR